MIRVIPGLRSPEGGMDEDVLQGAYLCLKHHIPPDVLEAFVCGGISRAECDYVESHLNDCEDCRNYIVHAQWSVSLIASAARTATGLVAVHMTPEGLVLLMLSYESNKWTARVRGPSVDGGSFVKDRRSGVLWCHESFKAMFPEHACTSECRVFVRSEDAAT